jgi:phage terminase Nu1 subunit (DNA packaging protein)
MTADGAVLVNKDDVARAFGVSLPTIARWISDGCPAVQSGGPGKPYQFDLAEVRRWRADWIAAEEASAEKRQAAIREIQAELDLEGGSVSDDVAMSLRHRGEYYDVERKRMALDEARAQLCKLTDVRHQAERALGFLADRLQSLPDYLERKCGLDAATVDVLCTQIDVWQAELARQLASLDDRDENARAA